MTEYKQVIVVRTDLDLSEGKLAAQVSHASLGSYKKSNSEVRGEWGSSGSKKVVLAAGDEKLEELLQDAKGNKIPAYLVKDAGRTELEPGTVTALGIGPAEEDKIDSITGHLKLLE